MRKKIWCLLLAAVLIWGLAFPLSAAEGRSHYENVNITFRINDLAFRPVVSQGEVGYRFNLTLYIVNPGDTLEGIASRFNVSLEDLIRVNRLQDRELRRGQVLIIPRGEVTRPDDPKPEPGPEPDPEPDPGPDPAPEPEPDPVPDPVPIPDPAPDPDPEPTPPAESQLSRDEQVMLDLVNQERTNRGLTPLKIDRKLVELARMKSQDMVDLGYFSHQSPTYGSPFDMMREAGVSYIRAGENLAGSPQVERAHTSLMNSPGHRANILNQSYTHIGIGIVEGSRYGKIYTQLFIQKP
ncbi:MAG: LysM peptidoglycan-binding domain-containing protein [Candidatus Syntrophonatronum acetioxidans]|uniref:LysM peptidoglycan-binding domain-containing protein n=1 Tax=Candidatus Syntrophonatronum acetioxidans TaxID=1795816 RepID=A0A424YC27_9FIRM|nr:MAG: LysM peptidoglycan-binding domain-containing protein [Candidatus Syntrophonatronum acetioxidans]